MPRSKKVRDYSGFLSLAVISLAVLLATHAGRVSQATEEVYASRYPYSELAVEYARATLRLAEAELA